MRWKLGLGLSKRESLEMPLAGKGLHMQVKAANKSVPRKTWWRGPEMGS